MGNVILLNMLIFLEDVTPMARDPPTIETFLPYLFFVLAPLCI